MSTHWEKHVVQRTIAGAGDFPGVQLHFLLKRLEQCPDALSAIADAIRDMGAWFEAQAAALEAEGRRPIGGAEIIPLKN